MEKRSRSNGFTLVEVMIVVLVIGILMGIAIPQFIRARGLSQQRTCLLNLRKIDDAKQVLAQEQMLQDGAVVAMGDIWPEYIKCPGEPRCPAGGSYTVANIGANPSCSHQVLPYPHAF